MAAATRRPRANAPASTPVPETRIAARSTLNAYNNTKGAPAFGACVRGEVITFTVEATESVAIDWCEWSVGADSRTVSYPRGDRDPSVVWDTSKLVGDGEHTIGEHVIKATVHYRGGDRPESPEVHTLSFLVTEPVLQPQFAAIDQIANSAVARIGNALAHASVGLRRSSSIMTSDVGLWILINRMAHDLSFNEYQRAMDSLVCGIQGNPDSLRRGVADRQTENNSYLLTQRFLPFNDTDTYRLLKVATEAFLLSRIGIAKLDPNHSTRLGHIFGAAAPPVGFTDDEIENAAHLLSARGDPSSIREMLRGYLKPAGVNGRDVWTIPYLALVSKRLQDAGIRSGFALRQNGADPLPEDCLDILEEKLTQPILVELIWSYWHEEGMVVQTMNAIARRFQNIRGPGEHDPLAQMEMNPLRPLNNLLWGYLQDEQHQLSILRRAYEYDHHYGISLYGEAVPRMRAADSRSRFLEAFHNLLYRAKQFYQQDDDMTVASDGFPVLNALREVHLVLSEGAHNQFGDLPSTARQEMLFQQWLLARPEFQQFLPNRAMVAYPEGWMGPVDAMKSLQGWTDTSVMQFHNLAMYGEKILLSIRYGSWSDPEVQPEQAKNWARLYRADIQGYIHAYRAVTGVDLTAEAIDARSATERGLPPSVHLRRLLEQQRRGVPLSQRLPEPRPALDSFAPPAAPNGVGRRVTRRLPAGR